MTAVHNCIPTKYVDPRRSPPWITPTILHQIRKKATALSNFYIKELTISKKSLANYEARSKKLYKKAESRFSLPWAAF
jgi:hypothetical protein